MKKYMLYLTLLGTAMLTQETYTMGGFGQKTSNCFRLTMKAAHYGALFAFPAYIIKNQLNYVQDQEKNPKALLSESSNQFILNTIHEAYPELNGKKIVILGRQGDGWMTAQWGQKNYLLTPLDDSHLKKAIAYKANNMRNPIIDMMEDTNKLAATAPCRLKSDIVNIAEYIAIEEESGVAMTPSTLDVWQGDIRHEASHLLHHDSKKNMVELIAIPFVISLGAHFAKKRLGLNTVLQSKPILGNILKGIGYLPSCVLKLQAAMVLSIPMRYEREYRADQDAIKRTKEPAALHAISANFNAYPEPETFSEKMKIFIGAHPGERERGRYFKEAAINLEDKLAQKID